MATTLTLPPDVVARLEALIASGAANDQIGAVRAAIEALEAEDGRRLEALRAKITRALDDPRPSVPADAVFDRLEALITKIDRP